MQANVLKLGSIVILLLSLLMVSSALAQDTLLISYQGYLTDAAGEPVTGTQSLTFNIYNAGGVSKWSEVQPDVDVDNGLLSVILGSQTALPDSVFNGDALYLGIAVGEDTELLPRTLLTSAPGAAVSRRVVGDIITAPGLLQLVPPDPCVPPEPCDPAFEMSADGELNELTVFSPPPDDSKAAIKISANNENKIDLFYPDGDSDEGIVQMGASSDRGGFLEVHTGYPPTVTRVIMGGSTTDTGFVRLMGGPDNFEYKLLELNSHTNTGGSIKFFDTENIDGRELLAINNSPATAKDAAGWEIVGFNPQPEPPGIPALELGMDFDAATIENYIRLNNPLTENLGEPLIALTSNQSEGGQFKIYELAPDVGEPSRELLTIGNNASEGIGIYGFNPQPEPPGQIAFELETESSRGPGGRFAVYDTGDARVLITGGDIKVGHADIAEYPEGSFKVSPVTCELSLTGESAAGDPPVISMVTGPEGARAGIGTTDLTEALCVIGNIALTGDVVALTDTKLKTNIEPIDNALETIEALNGVSYDWKADADKKLKLPDRRQIGLLADEVEAVLPELVYYDADGNRMVAYTKMTAVLIEAIKELNAENDELRKRLEILEEKLK